MRFELKVTTVHARWDCENEYGTLPTDPQARQRYNKYIGDALKHRKK